jgi:hypothetical protein
MKTFAFFLLALLFIISGFAQEYRNFYGICWRGKPHDNMVYARQMKYDYVFYQNKMENDTLSNGLYFYLETPEYLVYNRTINTQKTYTNQEKQFYETFCTIKDTAQPFPYNMATGWFFTGTSFTPLLDFQQQKVIDYTIDSILRFARSIEKRNPRFHFGGLAWDVPQPSGDFWDTIPKKAQVTLTHWTGSDAGKRYPNIVHDFPSYSEGHISFYKKLYSTVRANYPNAKFIMEPYKIYEDWIALVKDRPDAKELTPDLLSQEGPGIAFATDNRIFINNITSKDRVASTTPNKFSEPDNRIMAANAAVNGAWFTWYGRFGGTGDMPDYKNITELPDRLKLIRELANYENLNKTPLAERKWDNNIYQSKTAFASADAVAIMQPLTHKYFVVFLSKEAEVPLPTEKKMISIFKTNSFLIETDNGSTEVTIKNNKIKPNGNTEIGKAYIIQFDY